MTAPDATRLTREQDAVWRAIAAHYDQFEIGPTHRWLMKARNRSSSSSINHQLRALERKGYIRRVPGKAAGIVLLRRPDTVS